MAKKARTPRPPVVQAPKRRETRSGGRSGLGSTARWVLVGAGVLVAGVVAALALGLTGGGESASAQVETAMKSAGCTLRAVKPLPPTKTGQTYHADAPTLTSKTRWSTSPPSAGGHYDHWAVWGFYRAAVNPRQVVHNLEHGGVAIWWGPKVPGGTIDRIETFYRESPNGMIGTPFEGLGNKIVLTAWTGNPQTYYRGDYGMGHLATCTKFDEDAFAAFRSAFRGKGPEGIPTSSNLPGTGPTTGMPSG
jgi:hypothetical protein